MKDLFYKLYFIGINENKIAIFDMQHFISFAVVFRITLYANHILWQQIEIAFSIKKYRTHNECTGNVRRNPRCKGKV